MMMRCTRTYLCSLPSFHRTQFHQEPLAAFSSIQCMPLHSSIKHLVRVLWQRKRYTTGLVSQVS